MARLISSLDGAFVRAWFMAGVTLSVTYQRDSLKSFGLEEVKSFWKYSVATVYMPSSVSAQDPSSLLSFVMRFRARRCLVVA